MKKIIFVIVSLIACVGILILVFKYITVSPEKISSNIVPSSNVNPLLVSEQKQNNATLMSFEEVRKDGYAISADPVDIGGKLAYVATNDFSSFVVIYDGKEFGKQYAMIGDLYNVDNKLTYIASDKLASDAKVFLVLDGQEIGRDKGYDAIKNPISVNGKLAYWAEKAGKSFIVYDGKELGKEYDSVLPPQVINGNLIYLASKNNKTFLMPEKKELGRKHEDIPETQFVLINNIPAYIGYDNSQFYIVYDGKELGQEYYSVSNLQKVNGKLAYGASNDGTKFFIVYDGQKFGEKYDAVWGPHDINGKLAYKAQKDGKYFIVYNGQEVGKDYDDILDESITDIGGKLSFVAKKNNQGFIVIEK